MQSKILEDASKFKKVDIEEGKALTRLIPVKDQIIRLPKSLKDQPKTPEKEKSYLYLSGSKSGVLNWSGKIYKHQ